ncbi:MAG TPA: N-acetylglucosamine-6-phosphate deacetylase [Candidatus Blautia ornithocaccae]|nr:N-acetylglucosamine-6-phosphate deacetylase [Candidatus Blautia ornithocaccae]
MIIKNAMVFQEDGTFQKKDIYLEKGFLVSSEEEVTDKTEIDASGLKAIPGLVDVHSHGAFGHDFCDADPEGLKVILKYEKEHGITSYCPTSMTLAKEKLLEIFASVKDMETSSDMARIAGINMEGPFVDVKKKGAQASEHICPPDPDFFRLCNEHCGNIIKLVTLSPKEEGAMDFIRELKDEVMISLGHTTADYNCAKAAMDAGAAHVTHLFNAMPPFAHRDPGVIGAALDTENCMAELICDGYHIHPSMIRAAFKMFGEERICLISDSMMATGMPDGTYELGGQAVYMKDRFAALSDGTLAGSATNLFDCMKKAMEFGIPESTAIFAATRNPAKSIGIYDKVGSITPGKYADILLVDEAYNLKQVL